MALGSYQAAVQKGMLSGQAGNVVPYQTGPGSPVKYKFVSSGSSGQWRDQGRSGGVGSDYANLLADFQKREEAARASNLARETEIRGTYDQLISQGQGAFRTAGLADIEQAKTTAVGAGTQQMISSGLYGTTTAAALPVQAENQAALSRLKLEDIIQQRQAELKLGKAAFVERISEPYPDYGMLMQAMAARAGA